MRGKWLWVRQGLENFIELAIISATALALVVVFVALICKYYP